MKIFENLNNFSENIKTNFENLNDRITGLSNQQKCFDKSSTSSFTDIREDIQTFKSDIDKKTNSLLTKSQNLLDKVITTPDLVKNASERIQNNIALPQGKTKPTISKHATNDDNPVTNSVQISTRSSSDRALATAQTSESTHRLYTNKPFTFITGSCILRNIETKFLDQNVRVKTFKNVKIDTLNSALSKMDLSVYKIL